MLRSTIPFFTSASRQYAVGSAKHLQLQKELSRLVAGLHLAQTKLDQILLIKPIVEEIWENVTAEIQCGNADAAHREKLMDTLQKARCALASLENEKLCQTDNKEKISERVLKIVRDIREECGSPVIHAAAPVKLR